jgi:hypothetical protein
MTDLGVEYGAVYSLEGPTLISNVNQITNPIFETNTTGWSLAAVSWAASNFARFAGTFEGSVGGFIGRLTATKDATATERNISLSFAVASSKKIVVPGHKYLSELSVQAVDNTNLGYRIRVDWYNEGSFVSSSTSTALITGIGVTVLRLLNLEAPAGANAATFVFTAFSTTSGDTVDLRVNNAIFREMGARAVFNNDTDPDFIGTLDAESSGLDSSEVRENAQDATEEDGGVHGNFFAGRRPVTLHGRIIASTKADRNAKVAKLKRASKALRGDAILCWTQEGGPSVQLELRRQQPIRVTSGYVKEYFLPMVSADARIKSAREKIVSSEVGTSLKTAGTAANKSGEGSGALAWTNPGNITASDNVRATAVAGGSTGTNWLQATNFGHVLPVGAIPRGVLAKIEASRISGAVNVEILLMRMIVAGAMIENPSAWVAAWASATDEVKSFGSEKALIVPWSTTLSKAQIEASNWGVAMVANIPGVATMGIDAVQTEVFYRMPFIVENEGDEYADFTAVFTGETTSAVELKNEMTGDKLVVNTTMNSTDIVEIDTKTRTVRKNGVSIYSSFDFASSNWFKLAPGQTKLMSPNNEVAIKYRDSWA